MSIRSLSFTPSPRKQKTLTNSSHLNHLKAVVLQSWFCIATASGSWWKFKAMPIVLFRSPMNSWLTIPQAILLSMDCPRLIYLVPQSGWLISSDHHIHWLLECCRMVSFRYPAFWAFIFRAHVPQHELYCCKCQLVSSCSSITEWTRFLLTMGFHWFHCYRYPTVRSALAAFLTWVVEMFKEASALTVLSSISAMEDTESFLRYPITVENYGMTSMHDKYYWQWEASWKRVTWWLSFVKWSIISVIY